MSALVLPRHLRRGGKFASRPAGFATYGTAAGGVAAGGRWPLDLRPLQKFFASGEALAFWRLWDPSVVNYLDGPGEQLVNGGFELGTASWTPQSGALISSQPGSLGGGGALHLQVGLPLADGLGWVNQIAMVPGARYLCLGWAVGDGVNGKPLLSDGPVLWTGTTSTVPQYFAVEFTASNVDLRLVISGNALTVDSVGFDSLSLTELPGIRTVENDLNPGTYDLDFSLGAQQAWLHPTAWLGAHPGAQFDGVGHYGEANAIAAAFAGSDVPMLVLDVSHGTGFANNARLWALEKVPNAANESGNSTYQAVAGNVYNSVRKDDAALLTKFVAGTLDCSAAIVHAYHLLGGTSGATLRNEAADGGPTDQDVGIMAPNRFKVGARNSGGVVTNHWTGIKREMLVTRFASVTQRNAAIRRLMARNYLP